MPKSKSKSKSNTKSAQMPSEPIKHEIPDAFKSTMLDFLRDLSTTFPEFSETWEMLNTRMSSGESADLDAIFSHCLAVYPERFFDLLYQNEDIFKVDSDINTTFLPGMDFKQLYNCEGVTENTKKTIWKYLQLLMFSLLGSVKDKSNFGDSMNMFEGIDENELQSKMKETMDGIEDFFTNLSENLDKEMGEFEKEMGDLEKEMGDGMGTGEGDEDGEIPEEFKFDKTTGMPDLNGIHEHLKGLFDGKIGRLAKNIAEEISQDFETILGEDYKDVRSTKDVFQKMMKNPAKMMELIKKVGDKIKTRMDSGEISKDDIMAEAGDILRKMKEMSGGSDEKLQEMLRNMAKGMGMGKNAHVDMNAVNRMTKQMATRERILKKVNARRQAVDPTPPANYVLEQTGQSNFVFKMPEEGEQPRSLAPPPKYSDEELIAALSTTEPSASKTSGGGKKKKSKGKK